ncbi:erythromycin esterase family protein [Salinimicrobium flavum]|uniref:Erythromycin esterase family protein n=1 Tax=Salinimicrobium flavum TaxID=1737065 RepID=A0ABW5IV93_9FLAO
MTRNLFLLFTFLSFQLLQSQEIKTHSLLPPESQDHSDLHFLKEELEGKQLVMLGELTHMYGNIFEMKTRVIEYLHKELGYITIAMESSMYDLWLMNSEHVEFDPEAFNEAVFNVWSNTSEFQRLVNYIEQNDLKVVGFDSQIINNVPEFIDGFFEYCGEQNIGIKLDEDDMGIAMEEVLDEVEYSGDDITFKAFEKELKRIIKEMQELEETESNYYWLQCTKGMLASSRDAFYSKEIPYKSEMANKNHNFRDEQMADNLLTYLARNPDEKVVAWADNIHVVNDMSSVKDPVLREFAPMGSHIKKAMGDKVYSLATIHANDSLLENTTWHQTPVLKGSFEDRLAAIGEPYLFISSSQEALREPQQHRLLNFQYFSEARMDQLHDGYIFLRKATIPKKEAFEIIVSEEKEFPEVSEKLSAEESAASGIQGLIVDSETKQPIPFVNINLKEQGIYRISDKEGRFQLKIPQATSTGIQASITALGYESKEIPVNDLNGTITLVPAFEQLNEVVLNGFGTTPKKVMKRVIKEIEKNHPTDPFNYKKYGQVVLFLNDTLLRDIEFVTKEYYQGYRQKYFPEQKLEQVKWNHRSNSAKSPEYSTRMDIFRGNPIQFSSLLHKRKYKKFDLEFITSGKPENEGLYVIKFSTDKTRFGFTNYWFPSTYSGEIYINKKDFAVVKMMEKWESTLPEEKMEDYKYWHGEYTGDLKWTQDRVITYSQQSDGKYYASSFFERNYHDKFDMQGEFRNSIYEKNFLLYDYRFENLEVLVREDWKKNAALDRVEYDEQFWSSFEKEKNLLP